MNILAPIVVFTYNRPEHTLLTFNALLKNPLAIESDIIIYSDSAKTANLPGSLITGLKKMSKENLSNLTPHWLNVMLNYSHPPVLDRIDALKKYKN